MSREGACPIRIAKILTDNGKEFTDRLFASRARAPSGEQEFDLLCTELGIKLRLTPPKSPQTNGIPLVHFPMHCRAAG
jgi:transposase InsO family protein